MPRPLRILRWVLSIGLLQGVTTFIVYPGGMTGFATPAQSIVIFFCLPLLAFTAFVYGLYHCGTCATLSPIPRAGVIIFVSLIAALLSSFVSVLLPVNVYGT